MKDLSSYIFEVSLNAKRRNNRFIEKMFLNGKPYNGIKNFGIVTNENPNSIDKSKLNRDERRILAKHNYKGHKELRDFLKSNKYAFVPALGHFGENNERSYVIFNIDIEVMKYISGKYEQTSFFYCYCENGKLTAEYWEKSDTTKPYNKRTNDYEFINKTTDWTEDSDGCYTAVGKNFTFALDSSVFSKVNESIENNINILAEKNNMTANEIFESAFTKVGPKYGYWRSFINTFDNN